MGEPAIPPVPPGQVIGYMTIHATAEVRDRHGNLISSTPIEAVRPVTADETTERQDTP